MNEPSERAERDCAGCGAPHAANGIGPPLLPVQRWYCGPCLALQPATQRRVALTAREAIEDPEIIIS